MFFTFDPVLDSLADIREPGDCLLTSLFVCLLEVLLATLLVLVLLASIGEAGILCLLVTRGEGEAAPSSPRVHLEGGGDEPSEPLVHRVDGGGDPESLVHLVDGGGDPGSIGSSATHSPAQGADLGKTIRKDKTGKELVMADEYHVIC